jgi:transposase
VGTVERQTGECRLRVVMETKGPPLEEHVHTFTRAGGAVYTDEYQSYTHIVRPHATVSHGDKEWAREDDGDGIREVHCHTIDGLWTDVRNCLRLFKGVYKKFLAGYIAICEIRRNYKRIPPYLIADLVVFTLSTHELRCLWQQDGV